MDKKEIGLYPRIGRLRKKCCFASGKKPLTFFKEGETMEAVVAFLGRFYLIDLDHPDSWIVSLSILQRITFEDMTVHPDHEDDVTKAWKDLDKYIYGK